MLINGKQYYRVVKCSSNIFTIDKNGVLEQCTARKKIKKNSDIMVGDFVSVENLQTGSVLESVLPRKNSLTRPNVSNIDTLIIIAAAIPKIDYILIDKLIINAHMQQVEILLCLNKCDISDSELNILKTQYCNAVDYIIGISAVDNKLDELRLKLQGRLSCFAGQSAVGKSTIVNALINYNRQVTGELSQKILRGKNTTTSAEIIVLGKDTYIIDTPGFTMLDVFNIESSELALFYSEYAENSSHCRYRLCTHTVEPDCCIKRMVSEGSLSKERYDRYKQIYSEIKSLKKY